MPDFHRLAPEDGLRHRYTARLRAGRRNHTTRRLRAAPYRTTRRPLGARRAGRAGSPRRARRVRVRRLEPRLAEGVTIAGVDVGGLTNREARRLLERASSRSRGFRSCSRSATQHFPIKASPLGVEADWQAALETAASEGEGFGPVRGFQRLQTRFFGAEISPPVQAYASALDYKLGQIADEIDRSHVEAKLVRRGLAIAVVPGQAGLRLDREAAERRRSVAGAVRAGHPGAAARHRRPGRGDRGRARARRAAGAHGASRRLSGSTTRRHRWKLPRWRIAELLRLPATAQIARDRRARAPTRGSRG